jgi:hypothetical protein
MTTFEYQLDLAYAYDGNNLVNITPIPESGPEPVKKMRYKRYKKPLPYKSIIKTRTQKLADQKNNNKDGNYWIRLDANGKQFILNPETDIDFSKYPIPDVAPFSHWLDDLKSLNNQPVKSLYCSATINSKKVDENTKTKSAYPEKFNSIIRTRSQKLKDQTEQTKEDQTEQTKEDETEQMKEDLSDEDEFLDDEGYILLIFLLIYIILVSTSATYLLY